MYFEHVHSSNSSQIHPHLLTHPTSYFLLNKHKTTKQKVLLVLPNCLGNALECVQPIGVRLLKKTGLPSLSCYQMPIDPQLGVVPCPPTTSIQGFCVA